MTVSVTLTFPDHAAAITALSKLEGAPIATASTTEVKAETKTEKKTEKKTETKARPKHTRDEMDAALSEIVEAKGKDAAVKIINTAGGVAKRAEIPDDKIDAVYDACRAALSDGGEDDGL